MRRASFVALLGLSAVSACASRCGDEPIPSGTASPPKSAVPAPAGLAAEIQIARPSALLGAVRGAAGGSALFLPRTVGGLTASVLGLPIQIAELVDEQLPIVGAVAIVEGRPQAAFAVHLSDAARLETFVAGGRDATFAAIRDGDVTWLRPKGTGRNAQFPVVLGLVDNYLVAGDDERAVRLLGPYLARTMAVRAAPAADVLVTLTALAADPLRTRLRALPTPALPAAVAAWLPADDLGATLADLLEGVGAGTLELRLGERLEIDAHLDRAGAPRPGLSPKSLLDLPGDVVAAIGWAEERDQRAAKSATRAPSIAALLGGVDNDVVADALSKVARGMGERLALGLRCTGVGLTGLARGEVADDGALAEGLASLAALRDHAAVQARLDAAGLSLTFKKRRLERVPFDVFRFRLDKKEKADDGSMSEIDFLYGLDPSRFVAAAGKETLETTQRLASPNEETLGKRVPVADALGRLPDPTWLTAVVDAQGLHACTLGKPGGYATPVVVGVGAAERGLRVRFEMPRVLLRTLADTL
jgi:hypothetical protein